MEDDPGHLSMLKILLKGWGLDVVGATDGREALELVHSRPFDVLLMDVRMAHMDGIEALKLIKDYNPAIPVLIMTAYSSVNIAVDALKAGAYDYLTKPLDFEVLRLILERALDHTRLRAENMALRDRLPSDFALENVIGKSEAMRQLIEMVAAVAPSEATVLITGESGTGKELIAKAIHFNSPRKKGPLITVNATALSEHLMESELFGHEKGAFTGADKRREGLFVKAHHGSIFLDEIGDMSPAMQIKLLRVLQEREVLPVGADKPVAVDVRILTATNLDLPLEVEAKRFREDLYYRLNVVNLHLPPLRERKEDIPLLLQHFLEHYAEKNRKVLQGFTPQAMDLCLKYDWPGNVRELENAVERAVILAPGHFITERELPLTLTRMREAPEPPSEALSGRQTLEEVERQAIQATLEQTGGNKSEAARVLGISRATLHKKLARYELEP